MSECLFTNEVVNCFNLPLGCTGNGLLMFADNCTVVSPRCSKTLRRVHRFSHERMLMLRSSRICNERVRESYVLQAHVFSYEVLSMNTLGHSILYQIWPENNSINHCKLFQIEENLNTIHKWSEINLLLRKFLSTSIKMNNWIFLFSKSNYKNYVIVCKNFIYFITPKNRIFFIFLTLLADMLSQYDIWLYVSIDNIKHNKFYCSIM